MENIRTEIIKEKWEHFPMLRTYVGKRFYEFTLRGVEPNSHAWLGEILNNQIKQIYENAFNAGRDSVRNPIKEALGLEIIEKKSYY